MPAVAPLNGPAAPTAWAPTSFIYQLQNADPVELAATEANLFIIDYSRDGSDSMAYTALDLTTIRAGRSEVRVLAYLSIGEAEDYRWYWRRAWDKNRDGKPDRGAPSWLGPQNPEWRGNYRVRYWEREWQRIIEQYIEKINVAGFDGVYLDCVDAFEYWGDGGDLRQQRAADMAALVCYISGYARARHPGFMIVQQNGEELGSESNIAPSLRPANYFAAIDGIGREDVWFNGNRINRRSEFTETLSALQTFRRAGKFVLTIDYVTRADLRRKYFAAAEANGFLALAPRRALDRCPTPDMRPPFPGP